MNRYGKAHVKDGKPICWAVNEYTELDDDKSSSALKKEIEIENLVIAPPAKGWQEQHRKPKLRPFKLERQPQSSTRW